MVLAAVISTDDSIGKFELKHLSVIEGEGEDSVSICGRAKAIASSTDIRVAMSVDAPHFEDVFLSTLNDGQAVTIDRTEPTLGSWWRR